MTDIEMMFANCGKPTVKDRVTFDTTVIEGMVVAVVRGTKCGVCKKEYMDGKEIK